MGKLHRGGEGTSKPSHVPPGLKPAICSAFIESLLDPHTAIGSIFVSPIALDDGIASGVSRFITDPANASRCHREWTLSTVDLRPWTARLARLPTRPTPNALYVVQRGPFQCILFRSVPTAQRTSSTSAPAHPDESRMNRNACPLCRRRRARRACPALGHDICAVCCGTKRMSEIACPSDCSYLASSHAHPPAAVQRQRERDLRFLLPLVHGLTERQQLMTLRVQEILSSGRREAPPLTDDDAAQAARALAETYETASRGIIYEHAAGTAFANRLSGELKAAVEAMQSEGLKMSDADVAVALRRIETGARLAEAEVGGGPTAYLQLLRRVFDQAPSQLERGSDQTESESGLIVP